MRTLRAALVSVIVGVLCTVALVVNSGPARALEVPTPEEIALTAAGVGLLSPGVVTGAGAGAAGTAGAAGAVCATGVGCAALAVIGIGLLGYATRDYWMPWVKNNLPSGATVDPSGGDGFYNYAFHTQPVQGQEYQASATTTDLSRGYPRVQATVVNRQVRGLAQWITCRSKNASTGEWRPWHETSRAFNYLSYGPNGSTDTGTLGTGGGGLVLNVCNPVAGDNSYNAANEVFQVSSVEWRTGGGTEATKGSVLVSWLEPSPPDVTTTLTCKRPDGSTYTVPRVTPDAGDLVKVGVCTDPADVPTRVQLDADGTPQQDLDVSRPAADDTAYPLCAGTACFYAVHIDGTKCEVVAGEASPAACHSWTTLARSTDSGVRERVECFYGPYSVPVDLCYVLERVYEDGTTPATSPNTDGRPDTFTDPAPLPQPQPSASPSPSSTSSTTTQPSTSPSPGASSGPVPGTGTSGASTPQRGDCFPNGWGMLNPVEWVVKPIRCTLEPDPVLTRARVETVKTKLQTTGPGPLITAVGDLTSSVPAGGGCLGPAIPFSLKGVSETLHPFAACDEPMSTAAGYSRALSSLVVIVGGGLAIVRAIGSGFGWSFGMRGGGGGGD